MSRMYNPPHPGEVLYGLNMKPAKINVTTLAKHLSVDRKTISRLVNGKTSVTPEMALRLAKAFDTTPELWLNMQNQYDLWQVSKNLKLSDIRVLLPV